MHEREEATLKSMEISDTAGFYMVKVKYTVWPSIYGKQLPHAFPTEHAAMMFAEHNVSENKPLTRVYDPDGHIIKRFTYKPPELKPGIRKLKRRTM